MSAEQTGELEQAESEAVPTRSDTRGWWWRRWYQENASGHHHCVYGKIQPPKAMSLSIGNCRDVGAFFRLTNSYLLVCDEQESDGFCRRAQGDVSDIPVVKTSLAGCRVIGRMCVGNKKGLLVPEATTDLELEHLQRELPYSVEVKTLEDRLSALGNVIVCNDHVALIHPDLDKESEEIVADTLQVEVFRHTVANNSLVGSYCVINNSGGLVHVDASKTELEDLSSLLELQLIIGTVNHGSKVVALGLVANDYFAYAGRNTTCEEYVAIEKALQFPVHMCYF
ncbi:hypothetical protein Zmor_012441 [Zophobas morio]|uniref:Eukaryotic translation initiation factor 6 n=1 Tax=Zophobas morio TaxID=2755281 RepID=A0AA38IBI0_9CUCU|nr:hypothetical protein Zmor_012441 [Zophobas morio]